MAGKNTKATSEVSTSTSKKRKTTKRKKSVSSHAPKKSAKSTQKKKITSSKKVSSKSSKARKKQSKNKSKKNKFIIFSERIKEKLVLIWISFLALFQKKKKKRGRKKLFRRTIQRYHYAVAVRIRKLRRKIKKKNTSFIKRIKIKLGIQKGRGRPKKKKQKKVFGPFKIIKSFFSNSFVKTFLSVFITVSIVMLSLAFYRFVIVDLPSPTDLSNKEQVVTTKILDRNGKLLYSIYEDENRTLIPLRNVSPHMINATIAIEDREFFNHHGFSLKGIARAAWSNSQGNSLQGGSTITQQLVKNRLLSSERTIQRKIRELLLSLLVDGTYSKEEILEMYFNQVAYGGSTYGVEEAARRYFDKSARELTLAESALLAGLPAAPSVYSPFGSNPEYAYARQHEVLRRMYEDEYITEEEMQNAINEELVFRQDTTDINAPHFVMYVKKLLAERFGEEILTQGGLEVYTTLDLDLQNETQRMVTEEVESLIPLRVHNGAAMVTNPRTGEILAMVGSINYFDFANDGQVNVTLRPRQPGSSIKPLTYAVALERGQTPSTKILDAPITYRAQGSPPYSPKNYDGKYHGNVTLRESLGSSYNIPAVKTLATVGLDNVINKAEDMGITTWKDRKRFGLSLTLGGGEVRMIDMTQLYSTFANQGYDVEPNPFLEIRNYKGESLYKNKCALENDNCFGDQSLDPRAAYLISDILSDNTARSPAFGLRSVLHIPDQQVAVKTGTTNNLRDNWTIGYIDDRLVSVWVGNNDNTSMSYVASGVTGASPIWNNIMRLMLDENDPHTFDVPQGMVKVEVCAQTGTLPCRGCPKVVESVYAIGTEPTQACNPSQFYRKPTQIPDDPNRDKILDGIMIEG